MNHMNTDVNYLGEKLKCLTFDGTPKVGSRPLELLIEAVLRGPDYSDSGALSRTKKMSQHEVDILKHKQAASCVKCKEFPPGNMYVDDNGVYCHRCQPKHPNRLQAIPPCLLNMLDLLQLPCKNVRNGEGCKELLSRKTMNEHEKTCSKNLNLCHILGFIQCELLTDILNQTDYTNHLLKTPASHHGVQTLNVCDNGTFTVTIPKTSFDLASPQVGQERITVANVWCYILKHGHEEKYLLYGKLIPAVSENSDHFVQMSCISLNTRSTMPAMVKYYFTNSINQKGCLPVVQEVVHMLDCKALENTYFHTHPMVFFKDMMENGRLTININIKQNCGF